MKPTLLIRKLVPILHEDEHVLIVDKPAGIDTGGLPAQPVAGLAELLAAVRGPNVALHPITRLSRYESGVLLFAKSAASAKRFRERLREAGVTREYVAVVRGVVKAAKLTIGAEHGTSRGKAPPGRSTKPKSPARSAPHPTTTVQRVRQGERRAIVRCRTTVENTHRLRAQLRSVGLRLVGDHLHDESRQSPRQELTCLHLSRLVVPDWSSKTTMTSASRPPDAFERVLEGERPIERALHAALVRRVSLLIDTGTDAYRLLTGDAEDVHGLSVERFGDVVLMQLVEEMRDEHSVLRRAAQWYVDALGVGSVHVKRFVKEVTGGKPASVAAPGAAKALLGRSSPERLEIRERGLKYAIRPHDGFAVGLFLDHRDNRSRVRSLAGGKDVLNLFAYTCGFSVAAAAGGAKTTVSVDVSPKHLDWGRENFSINGLAAETNQFIKSDAGDYLKRAERQDKRFDLIILDPPTFAHGRKRGQSFSVARDLADLVGGAAQVLNPGGVLLVSSNFRKLTWRELREQVKRGATGRKHVVMENSPLPVDFAVDRDHAKTLFVTFGPGGPSL